MVIEVLLGMKYIVYIKRRRKFYLYVRLLFQWLFDEYVFKVCIFLEFVFESVKVIQQVFLFRNNMIMIIIIVFVVCFIFFLVVGIVVIVCCRRWNFRYKKFVNVKRVIVMRLVSRRREVIFISFQYDNLIFLFKKKINVGSIYYRYQNLIVVNCMKFTIKSLFFGILYFGYLM